MTSKSSCETSQPLALGCVALLFVGLWLLPRTIHAQRAQAAINGEVHDSSGAVIPDASILLHNNGTNLDRPAMTNSVGAYVITDIQPGNYDLRVSKDGFTTSVQTLGDLFCLTIAMRFMRRRLSIPKVKDASPRKTHVKPMVHIILRGLAINVGPESAATSSLRSLVRCRGEYTDSHQAGTLWPMALSDIERNILNKIVDRFLNFKECTSRKTLVREFEDPDAIDRLQQWQLLKSYDGTNYLPTALSFHYCGNDQTEALARRAVQVFAQVFRNMYLQDEIDFTPEGLRQKVEKVYDNTDEQLIRLGLYLSPDLGLLSGWTGGNQQQTDITPTGINERLVKLKNIETLWDDYVRDRIPWPVQDSFGGIVPRHPTFENETDEKALMTNRKPSILVMISHSSKDRVLAEAVIDLLRSGFGIVASQIRCSSVDGYRLPAGVNSNDQLREEITSVRMLVGLLTPNSLASTYVLFELGARWGAGLFMIPLLAGIEPEEMRGPHGVLNALSCGGEAQLIQFVEDTGIELNIRPQSGASYLKQVRAVKELAEAINFVAIGGTSEQGEMVFEESVRWKRHDGKREGPYCPVCYEDKNKVIHLIPGATKGTYHCGVCMNGFHTGEYDSRPARRRPYGSP